MKAPTDYQIIEKDGIPVFVLVPYKEFIRQKPFQEKKVYLPQEVVEKHVLEDKSLVRAWREHKDLSQEKLAKRMGISQAAYSQMEKPGAKLRKATYQKIAEALEIDAEQLKV